MCLWGCTVSRKGDITNAFDITNEFVGCTVSWEGDVTNSFHDTNEFVGFLSCWRVIRTRAFEANVLVTFVKWLVNTRWKYAT